jgi:hypothetical protein
MQCKYSVIKWMQDTIREETINIGITLHCLDNGVINTVCDYNKINIIKILYPEISIKNLLIIFKEIETKNTLTLEKCNIYYLAINADMHANSIRFSAPKGLLTENLEAEMDELLLQYVKI